MTLSDPPSDLSSACNVTFVSVFTVSVDIGELEALRFTVDGLNVQVMPAGRGPQLRLTAPD